MAKNHRKGRENVTLMPQAPRAGKPELGDVYTFIPDAFSGETSAHLPGRQPIPRRVTGKVVCINDAHRYFRVEHDIHGYHLSECFKF